MSFFSQKTQELAAERHYSLVRNAKSKNNDSMQPKSVEKRCLFFEKMFQEIAENAGYILCIAN